MPLLASYCAGASADAVEFIFVASLWSSPPMLEVFTKAKLLDFFL